MIFKFELNQLTEISISGEKGRIKSRCESCNHSNQYLVHYKAADGRAVDSWFDESDIRDVKELNKDRIIKIGFVSVSKDENGVPSKATATFIGMDDKPITLEKVLWEIGNIIKFDPREFPIFEPVDGYSIDQNGNITIREDIKDGIIFVGATPTPNNTGDEIYKANQGVGFERP